MVSALQVARFSEAIGADANDLADAEAVARFVMVHPDLARTPTRKAIQADLKGSHYH